MLNKQHVDIPGIYDTDERRAVCLVWALTLIACVLCVYVFFFHEKYLYASLLSQSVQNSPKEPNSWFW